MAKDSGGSGSGSDLLRYLEGAAPKGFPPGVCALPVPLAREVPEDRGDQALGGEFAARPSHGSLYRKYRRAMEEVLRKYLPMGKEVPGEGVRRGKEGTSGNGVRGTVPGHSDVAFQEGLNQTEAIDQPTGEKDK